MKEFPLDDPSGDRLRDWMGISKDIFYDATKIAIVPMGFCYPGTGINSDLPPRKECAERWRSSLINRLSAVEFALIIGQYAIEWHLGKKRKKTLTETVKSWRDYWPENVVLPHPSPRNNIWLKKTNGLRGIFCRNLRPEFSVYYNYACERKEYIFKLKYSC